MKTHITHKQEKVLYRVVEGLKRVHTYEEDTKDWQDFPTGMYMDAVAGELEAAFPKIDGYDLYRLIVKELETSNYYLLAQFIIDKCRDEWLFDCERRGFREWCFVTYMTWDDVGRDRCLDAIRKVAQVFKKKEKNR